MSHSLITIHLSTTTLGSSSMIFSYSTSPVSHASSMISRTACVWRKVRPSAPLPPIVPKRHRHHLSNVTIRHGLLSALTTRALFDRNPRTPYTAAIITFTRSFSDHIGFIDPECSSNETPVTWIVELSTELSRKSYEDIRASLCERLYAHRNPRDLGMVHRRLRTLRAIRRAMYTPRSNSTSFSREAR